RVGDVIEIDADPSLSATALANRRYVRDSMLKNNGVFIKDLDGYRWEHKHHVAFHRAHFRRVYDSRIDGVRAYDAAGGLADVIVDTGANWTEFLADTRNV